MSPRLPILTFLLAATVAHGAELASPKVLERYQQMLEKNPGEGTALERLWKAYLDAGRTAELIEQYRASGTFSSELVLGHLLKRAARPEEALAAFTRAAQLDARSPLAPLEAARVQRELGHAPEAAELFGKAVVLSAPDDARLADRLLELGAAWLAAGDAGKATAAWERTVELHPGDLELRRRLADTCAENDLPERALRHLDYLDAHAPPAERALALRQRARIHLAAGDQDAAIAALEKALALIAPENWLRGELTAQLIRLHQRYHRTPELEERWKKFAAGHPRDLGACLQLVDLYERLGDFEPQRTWLTAALALAPKNAACRLKLARLLAQMDLPEAAAEQYDRLLAEQPANSDFVFARAEIDLQRGAAPAARQRVATLLAAKKNDETVRARALEFYQRHGFPDLVEAHLTADAAGGQAEAVVALANFLFDQRREDEARRTLARMIIAGEPAAQRAAAHARMAQIFQARNDPARAAAALTEAEALQPEARDFPLALGDLRAAGGDQPAAQAAFSRALQLSRTDPEREQAEQKLFESLRGSTTAAEEPASADTPAPNPALGSYFKGLERAAAAGGSAAGWLRLARWRLWNRDLPGAQAATQKALALDPKSVATCEMAVKLNSAGGSAPLAVFQLMKLAEIDPANRAGYRRRAGQVELQAGRIAEALAIFEELAKASPGSLEALTDLALTQQRAERWADALATWRQVYALSPGARKKEAFAPLLLALERLGQHPQSAELQLQAIGHEADQRQQFALFGDLLAHCAKHGLLDWLRAQFEERHRRRADDYFTGMALGRILKASGRRAAAFEVLADASLAAEDPAVALPELVREAEELRKTDAAAQLQERLLRVVPSERAAGFEKLAQLQEKNADIDGAARTWERILAKFPRDAAALGHAIEFQLRWSEPARAAELLRRARALEPANLRTLAALADLDIEHGGIPEAREARACLEEILRLLPAEKPAGAVRFPAARTAEMKRLEASYLATVGQRQGRTEQAALRTLRDFWVDEARDPGSAPELRLNAIRQLARLTVAQKDPAALAAWVKRWQAVPDAAGETLWALFYAGAGALTLDRVEALMAADPQDPKTPLAFIWLALQTQEFARLGAWLQDARRTPAEHDALAVALDQFLEMHDGRLDPALVEKLFPAGAPLRLWQAATLFAAHDRFGAAAHLGRRFFDRATAQRGMCGQELARWYLLGGEAEQARAVLRETIKSPADSFASPVCAALRDSWLLLPESERAPFAEAYLAGLADRALPLHVAISTVLLRGLAAEEKAACAALEKILELRPMAGADTTGTSASRRWRFLLAAGMQLQDWRLEKLAIFLWEKTLEDDALIQLQTVEGQTVARDIRQQLTALQIAHGPRAEVPVRLETYTRFAPSDGFEPLVTLLAEMQAGVASVTVCRQIWERNLGEPAALRKLLQACRAAGDEDTAEEVLRTSLGAGAQRLNDAARPEFAVQLADLLDRRGESDGACIVLAEMLAHAPDDLRLLLRLAQMNERAGRVEDAEAIYRRLLTMEPGNVAARLGLAGILEKAGRLGEALALFQNSPEPEAVARVALLLVKNHQPEDALAALERLPTAQQGPVALGLAGALAAQGERRLARTALLGVLSRSADAGMNFALQTRLVELLAPEDGAAAARRELRRLRSWSAEAMGNYLEVAAKESARLHLEKDFAREVAALWADGSGPIPAGVMLLKQQLAARDRPEAGVTLARLLAREDAPAVWLLRAADELEHAKLPELAARVLERTAKLHAADEPAQLRLARALRQLGRTDGARTVLETLASRAALSDELPAKLAGAFAELGDETRARQLCEEAMRHDPFARDTVVFLEAARLQLAAKDYPAAKRTLRAAFANPANRRFEAIIDWLVATEKMERFDAACLDFRLTAPRLRALRTALFAWFERGSQAPHALALIEAHPEILQPGMGARLREMAKGQSGFAPVVTLLERAVAQAGESRPFALALAQIYGDWAEAELLDGQTEAALSHLQQAREFRPDLADLALRLSALQAENGDRRGAIRTLETFLAVARVPAEIEQARAQLAKLKPGG